MKRSKRSWLLALSLSAVMLGTAGMFAACGETSGDPECEHEWGEWSITTPATCIAKGEETRVCTKDATHTETREVEKVAHTIEQYEAQAPTCTEVGWEAYEACTVEGCDYTTKVELPVQHTIVEHEGKDPTYTEGGWAAYETCSVEGCDYTTYTALDKLNVGSTWGSVNDNLVASSTWDLTNDNGTASASISLASSNADNNIYMYNVTSENVYAEVKINATGVLNNEKFGKIGLTVTSADGQKGIFYYIDAASSNGTTINDTSSGLGYNVKNGSGAWANNWTSVGSIGLPATAYTGTNSYVTLGIYRQGGLFSLYVDDLFVASVSCDILAGEEAYIGLASFNITANVKEYTVKTEAADLESYKVNAKTVTNLFIGDSYVDTYFWYTYATDFGASTTNENIGIGGTQTDDWQYKSGLLQQMYNVENIIINIGVNDIDDDKATGEETIARLQRLFATYHEAFPTAQIYYMSIVDNMLFTGEWDDYATVRAWMEENAGEGEYAYVTYVDYNQYITKDAYGSTQMWFNADGLHLGVDGYAVWTREIKRALGIERTTTAGGLGDITVEGAPAYSYSAGWTVDGDVWHNTGIREQQVFISGAYGEDVYAEATISVAGNTLSTEEWGKAGLAIRSTKGTWFFFLNCADGTNNGGTYYNDTWGNIIFRPETINRNWSAELYRDYMPFYGNTFDYNTDASFKNMAVAKIGTDLYFLTDGRVVNVLSDVLAADDKIAVSIFNFNMDMYAKGASALNENSADNALINKLNSLKIYEDTDNITMDGDISDWKASATAANRTHTIPATDGRSVTVYAMLGSNGVYVFYDVIHYTYKTNDGAWHVNSNAEMRFMNDTRLRYVSAGGHRSFYRTEGEGEGVINGTFVSTPIEGTNKVNTKLEMFISYATINGVDRTDAQTKMGFTWKTGGEGGLGWDNEGDYWYSPEACGGGRQVIVTTDGIKTGSAYTIDGNLSDWNEADFVTAQSGDKITAVHALKLKDDGFYYAIKIQTASITVTRDSAAAGWWLNTNLEFMNDESASHANARVMMFGGKVYHTGFVTDAAATYIDGDEYDTLIFEVFIANETLRNVTSDTESVKINIGGQTYWDNGNGGYDGQWSHYTTPQGMIVTREAAE